MAYRDFMRPTFSHGEHTTGDWISWMSEQKFCTHSCPRSRNHGEMCGGSTGDGFSRCFDCNRYGSALDALIGISYSFDDGMESMLHRYKDWAGYRWASMPLGSVLYTF